ncbi:MAG: hypothetical protein SWX82_06860, partial [Cyanobacteriota bacterium]|nr:hypothetical protein [Cyanobacteriota bacterium]
MLSSNQARLHSRKQDKLAQNWKGHFSYQLSVISYQLSVPTAKAGENENTLIEYFFIPLKGGG